MKARHLGVLLGLLGTIALESAAIGWAVHRVWALAVLTEALAVAGLIVTMKTMRRDQ